MKALLHQYAAYGLWADTRFVERLQQEPDAVLDAVVPSSFPSLRATLLHIRNAEHTWWGRITGNGTNWPAETDGSLNTVLVHSKRFSETVLQMEEDMFHEMRQYNDLHGNIHEQPVWQMVLHCVNHSTQHRGQLITMMRFLGLKDIPSNDLVVFQRLMKNAD